MIYVFQGSVETKLRCRETFDNHLIGLIANYPQNVPVKEF